MKDSQGLNTLATAALNGEASGKEEQQTSTIATGQLSTENSSKSLDANSVVTTNSNPQARQQQQHFTMTSNLPETNVNSKSSSVETQNWQQQQQSVPQQQTYSATPAGLSAFLAAQNGVSNNLANLSTSSNDTSILSQIAYLNLLQQQQQQQQTSSGTSLLNPVSNPLTGFDTNTAMSLVVAAQQATQQSQQQRGESTYFHSICVTT